MSAASPLWKSKPFWAFLSVSSAVGGGVAYDRLQAKNFMNEFMAEARKYGQAPLLEDQQPQCISLLYLADNSDASEAIRSHFKKYSVQLLTLAGVDYVWALRTDTEAVSKEWNRAAQDANAPEKMLDEGKRLDKITIEDELLKTELLSRLGKQVTLSDSLWQQVQEKLAPKRVWSPHFVALNSSTFATLAELVQEIKTADALEPIETEVPPNRSWFSWTTQPPSKPVVDPSLLNLDAITLSLLDCERSTSFKDRSWRFLFGQTELVRSIGQSTLDLIRSLNEQQ